MGEEKKNLAWERDQTRLTERCRVPRDAGSVMVETNSLASPIVSFGGRKFVCRTSMYDKSGLSTNNTCLKDC